jgi:predicted DNA-binding protein
MDAIAIAISLSKTAYENLTSLAQTSGETMQTVLDKAIENYRRYVFLVQANQAYAALRRNEELWQEELAQTNL